MGQGRCLCYSSHCCDKMPERCVCGGFTLVHRLEIVLCGGDAMAAEARGRWHIVPTVRKQRGKKVRPLLTLSSSIILGPQPIARAVNI